MRNGIAEQSPSNTWLSPELASAPLQRSRPRVAFQGERGAYGEDAMEAVWHRQALSLPSWTFSDVVTAVLNGIAEYGVLPIHNVIAGPIAETQQLLETTPSLRVVTTVSVPVHHVLMAPSAVSINELRLVTSHPVALAQCQIFLRQYPHLSQVVAYDTAGAARDVAARRNSAEGAIASAKAARRYKLQVLAEEIQDVADNETRFVVIERGQHEYGARW